MRLTQLFEAEPIDLAAHRRRRAVRAIPDTLKHASAAAQQRADQPAAPGGTLSDVARDIILRNLDKIFAQEPLPDEDRAQLRTILQANDMISRMRANTLVNQVLDVYRQVHRTKVFLSPPDPRGAYLQDDPSLAKWRLDVGGTVATFDTQDQVHNYVLSNLLSDGVTWPEADKTALKHRIERQLADPVAVAPFDPMQRPKNFDDTPRDELLPFVDKILRRYAWHNDVPAWLSVEGFNFNTGRYDHYTLKFRNAAGPARQKQFPSLAALEQWVIDHQDGLAAWYRRQQTIQHGDLPRIRMAERRLLGMIRQVLAGTADPDKIKEDAWTVMDHVLNGITNKPVRDFLESGAYVLAAPQSWSLLTEFHLTWIPERVRELLAEAKPEEP